MRIALVTLGFPFGRGETFLASEVDAIASAPGVSTHLLPVRGRHELASPAALTPAVAWALIDRLGRSETAAELATAEGRSILGAVGGTCRRNPRRPAAALVRHIGAAAALSHAVRRRDIDHIHAYWAGPVAAVAQAVADAHGITWSFTGHRGDIAADFDLARQLEGASWVRAISQRSASMMLDVAGSARATPEVLHLGHRLPAAPPPRTGPVARILVPANLLPVKGHLDLIEAATLLATPAAARCRIELVGDGPERPRIEAAVAARGLGGRVTLRGWLSHADLLAELEGDVRQIVVLPSRALGPNEHEGIPIALVEAMARSNPVIATSSGGIPELLAGGAGLLVEPSDPASLASAIDRLASEPALFDRLAARGRARIQRDFDVDRIVGTFLDRIGRCLRHEAAPAVHRHPPSCSAIYGNGR